MRVQEFLADRRVPFHVITHAPTFGALRVAQAASVSGHDVAKSVIVLADGQPVLAVIPATRRVDLNKIRDLVDAGAIRLADEARCAELFPDCEVGAMPPFGSANGMRTILDLAFNGREKIVFEGNRHDEAIEMTLEDFQSVERPLVADITKSDDEGFYH